MKKTAQNKNPSSSIQVGYSIVTKNGNGISPTHPLREMELADTGEFRIKSTGSSGVMLVIENSILIGPIQWTQVGENLYVSFAKKDYQEKNEE